MLAGLVDVRSETDDRTRAEVAHRLGCRIDVVSLVGGRIELPEGMVERVAAELPGRRRSSIGAAAGRCACRTARPRPALAGGRADGRPARDAARRSGPGSTARSGSRRGAGGRGRAGRRAGCSSSGTEELMYLPLRIALDLVQNPPDGEVPGRQVLFQSTTRSPVLAVDGPGYPVRRRIDFVSDDRGHGGHPARSTTSGAPACRTLPSTGVDVIVVIDERRRPAGCGRGRRRDRRRDRCGRAAVQASRHDPHPARAAGRSGVRQLPPRGGVAGCSPTSRAWTSRVTSGSGRPRSSRRAHYAESLPVEYQPDPAYQRLFDQVLAGSAARLARGGRAGDRTGARRARAAASCWRPWPGPAHPSGS